MKKALIGTAKVVIALIIVWQLALVATEGILWRPEPEPGPCDGLTGSQRYYCNESQGDSYDFEREDMMP